MKKNGLIILSVVLMAGVIVARADGQLEPANTSPTDQKPLKKAEAKPAKTKKAKAAAEKPSEKKATATEKPIILSPGPATIAGNNVNVRGRASFNGEVFTKLQNGDAVTVIEQVLVAKPKAGEPSNWAKIAYPSSAHVWIHNSYIDENKTVKPKKLNVRTGAGENYSVVGVIEKGTPVKEISTKGNWTEIEAPAGAYGFVAAHYLKQDASSATVPPVVTIAPPEPPTSTTVSSGPLVATTTTDVVSTNPAAEPTHDVVSDPNSTNTPVAFDEVLVPRVVSHEGIVRGTVSIQAPSKYGLYSKENGKLINYLYSPTTALELSRYYNLHIIVTGQEGLDERWAHTPVLTIQKIYVVKD